MTEREAHWAKVQELFELAADLPERELESFLDRQCSADQSLRAEIEALLAADRHRDRSIQAIIGDVAMHWAGSDVPPSRTIGPYRILGEIGRGGMGTVFHADRADSHYHQRVAIKMARFGVTDAFTLRRFRHERQILANLEHPHIARLLDGGETAEGLPYLVMEYIEGRPITEFAAAHALDPAQKLTLFLKIIDAVQYAHRLLIIHRDLKPSNILVTEQGEPKLLDFGIAKLLEPGPLDDPVLQTSTGMQLMTPDYASPEQVRGLQVTTASDVYSLGALLFELLTGVRPHRLKDYSAIEIDQAVCEKPTEKPSTSASNAGRPASDVSILRADVDLIVLKAMHKDPARRYSSAERLADDIRRYLSGQPIEARPDSPGYRGRLFLKRHKVAASAALLLLLTLSSGVAATLWQAHRASREAQRADLRFRQVRHLANRFLFDFDAQAQKLDGSTPLRQNVVSTAQQYLDSLFADASGDPELQTELAVAYNKLAAIQGGPRSANLGRSADALRNYMASLEIGRRLFSRGRRDPMLLQTMSESSRMAGLLERRLHGVAGSKSYIARIEESIKLADELYSREHSLVSARLLASSYRELGEYFADTDQAAPAESNYRKALPLYREVSRRAPGLAANRGVAMVIQRIGDATIMRGDLESGRQSYLRAISAWESIAGSPEARPMERRSLMDAYLSMCALLGDPAIPNLAAKADAGFECGRALRIANQLALSDPANHAAKLDLAYAEAQYGRVLRASRPRESVQHAQRATELSLVVLAGARRDQVYLRHSLRYRLDLGRALHAMRKYGNARKELERVLSDSAPVLQDSAAFRLIAAEAARELGLVLVGTGRTAEGRNHAVASLRSIEPYYRAHLDSIEMIDDLSEFYEAAALATRELRYLEQARLLWIEWPNRGVSSAFDRRRLREVNQLMAALRTPPASKTN